MDLWDSWVGFILLFCSFWSAILSSLNVSARFFPESRGRKCYRIPVDNATSLVLVRAKFLYKNYDGLGTPPTFSVSLGTAIAATINLAKDDPWTEEFLWTVNKDILPFCLIAMPNGGSPVISSLEIRPLPQGAFNQSNLVEKPPAIVLQSARVLARRNTLTYNLSLDAFGDYYIILYFAGILPVFPSFDVIINGDLVESNLKSMR